MELWPVVTMVIVWSHRFPQLCVVLHASSGFTMLGPGQKSKNPLSLSLLLPPCLFDFPCCFCRCTLCLAFIVILFHIVQFLRSFLRYQLTTDDRACRRLEGTTDSLRTKKKNQRGGSNENVYLCVCVYIYPHEDNNRCWRLPNQFNRSFFQSVCEWILLPAGDWRTHCRRDK